MPVLVTVLPGPEAGPLDSDSDSESETTGRARPGVRDSWHCGTLADLTEDLMILIWFYRKFSSKWFKLVGLLEIWDAWSWIKPKSYGRWLAKPLNARICSRLILSINFLLFHFCCFRYQNPTILSRFFASGFLPTNGILGLTYNIVEFDLLYRKIQMWRTTS
jgi:hypothetical protein